MSEHRRPVVLCVLDGIGERAEREGNAVAMAKTPVLDRLRADYPRTALAASGEVIGAKAGESGSGAHGHLILGVGRPVATDRALVDAAIAKRKFGVNEMVDQTMRICLYDKCPLHVISLLSDSGDHASPAHLYELLELASFHEIPMVIHGILDGRARGPRAAMRFIEKLEVQMEGRDARIGTLSGRYWAMDRDGRWDRTYRAFQAMVRDKTLGSKTLSVETAFDAVAQSYNKDIDDEMFEPVRIGDYTGMNGDFMCDFSSEGAPWEWTGEDVGVAACFRGDRMQQLTAMLTRERLPAEVADDLLMDRRYPTRAFREHCFLTLTEYHPGMNLPVAFKRKRVDDSFGACVAAAGLKQARIAESEKRPHVGVYFDGGNDAGFEGSRQTIVASPQLVDEWREKPALSAAKIADAAVASLRAGEEAFILVNFANADVLAHSGDVEATIAGIEAVDAALGRIAEAARGVATLLVTSSHGNAERMLVEGRPHTAHTDSPVPFIWVAPDAPALRDDGSLVDVAPTMLEILGLAAPQGMTGRSLRKG